jgi:hypothetical protein
MKSSLEFERRGKVKNHHGLRQVPNCQRTLFYLVCKYVDCAIKENFFQYSWRKHSGKENIVYTQISDFVVYNDI